MSLHGLAWAVLYGLHTISGPQRTQAEWCITFKEQEEGIYPNHVHVGAIFGLWKEWRSTWHWHSNKGGCERVISQMGVFCPPPRANILSTSYWIDIGCSLDCTGTSKKVDGNISSYLENNPCVNFFGSPCTCIGLTLYSSWIPLGFCLDWIDIGLSLDWNWTGLDQSIQPLYTSTDCK